MGPVRRVGVGAARDRRLRDAGGFLGRFLRAWGLVTIVGVGVALASGLAPVDRFVTFGFVVPILAAFGLVRLWDALASRRVLAVAAAGALGVAMLAGAWIAWTGRNPSSPASRPCG